MLLLHTADLHIGKSLGGYSLLEDQEYILARILEYIKRFKADGLLVSGDIFDRPVPQEEALKLFGGFLTKACEMDTKLFIVGGNHDSGQRLEFASKILERGGLYVYGKYDGTIHTVETAEAVIHLLPFISPAQCEGFFEAKSHEEAVKEALSRHKMGEAKKNIILTHQFFNNSLSDYEAGGLDMVNGSLFAAYDYVAAGHLHRAFDIGDNIRYAGSPLKYSVSESFHNKSLTKICVGKEITREELPLIPLRDLRRIKGPLEELLKAASGGEEENADYIYAIVTDLEGVGSAQAQEALRKVYPYILGMETAEEAAGYELAESIEIEGKGMEELFIEFFTEQHNRPPKEAELNIVRAAAGYLEEPL